MKSVTAKELKNRTGDVLRRVGGGERVLITKRGRPYALLSPLEKEGLAPADLRPYAEAWEGIEKKLKVTKPRHRSWEEAVRWSRRKG